MPNPREDLQVLVHTSSAKTTLVADLSRTFNVLSFSTALHGGFRDLHIMSPMDLGQAYLAWNRENLPGWHFYHLTVYEDTRIVWEGRIIEVGISGQGLELWAQGYYGSLRDQFYDAADAGNTDWTAGGPHTVDDIIKEMLTGECPDINSDQTNIDAPGRDVTGIDLTDRDYVHSIIVDKLAPLADSDNSPWYFAVWENRIPYYKKRDVSTIHWYVSRRALTTAWRLRQAAVHYRSRILPVKNNVEGTSATNADAEQNWPIREAKVTVPTGAPTNAENDLRDTFLEEVRRPRQTSSFPISGPVLSATPAHHLGATAGAGIIVPKWWVRAGDTMRIDDLIPSSVATSALDDLRTFFLMNTQYDAVRDVITVSPDRPPNTLSTLLARRIQLEADR